MFYFVLKTCLLFLRSEKKKSFHVQFFKHASAHYGFKSILDKKWLKKWGVKLNIFRCKGFSFNK